MKIQIHPCICTNNSRLVTLSLDYSLVHSGRLTLHKDPIHTGLQTQTEKLHQYLLSSDQVRAPLVYAWKEVRPHAQVY